MTNCCKPTEQDIKMKTPAKNITVAAVALIDKDGRILISKRPEGKHKSGYWEFPGGKMEEDEAPQITLVRELQEELGIEVCTGCLTPLNFTSYRYEDFHLLMPVFTCRNWEGVPQGKEGQLLKWVRKNELKEYQFPEANGPILQALRDL